MSIKTKIRVLIVDDQPIVRHGLTALLRNFNEFEIVGEAGSSQIAITLCNHYQPDVVLMEVLMPNMNGIEVIQLLTAQHPTIRVIVLTSALNEILLLEALKAGAIGYLLKTGSIDEVADAVRLAYQGQPALAQEVVEALISIEQHPPTQQYYLTQRQRQVLSLMIHGWTNHKIAKELTISVATVKNHIVGIYKKLHVNDRTSAVSLAIRQGILK